MINKYLYANLMSKESEKLMAIIYSMLQGNIVNSIDEIKDLIPNTLMINDFYKQGGILTQANFVFKRLKSMVKSDEDKKTVSDFIFKVFKAKKYFHYMKRVNLGIVK